MSGRLRTTLRALLAPTCCIGFGLATTAAAVSLTADATYARRADAARRSLTVVAAGVAGTLDERAAAAAVSDEPARVDEARRQLATVLHDVPVPPDTWAALSHDDQRVVSAPGARAGFVTVARVDLAGHPGWTLDAVAPPRYFADPAPAVAGGVGATATVLGVAVAGAWSLQARRRHAVEARLADSVHAALHDPLTGLPNRAHLMEWLPKELARAAADGSALGVMFLDVDRFKTVNDTLGHATGDDLLREVASRLSGSVRHGDLVARLAGDEFVIAAPRAGNRTALVEMAERVLAAFETPVTLRSGPLLTGLSIGLTLVEPDGAAVDPVAVLEQADAAMYVAKGTSGRRVAFFDDALRAASDDRQATSDALRVGLGRSEVIAHFQPVVAVADGAVVGVEAFVRWNRPGHGLLAPGSFLDAAERSGLMASIGRLVLREAAHQAGQWNRRLPRAGGAFVPVGVNVSERQLLAPDFVDVVAEVLEEAAIPPAWLHLELAEAVALDRRVQRADAVARLGALGVGLVIDDFGVGHGSLRLLERLGVTTVKVAAAAVHRMADSSADAAIVAAVVPVAGALGARAVAAGVETPSQFRMLARAGFDAVQGHLVMPPVAAEQLDPSRRLPVLRDASPRR